MNADVIVVGAGMAGLACARALQEAGMGVLVLDKGRGIGGRMATRRVALEAGAVRFDHGAQYVTAEMPEFSAFLQGLAGAVAAWDADAAPQGAAACLVGLPGMSGLPRAMAAGLEIRQGCAVTSLEPEPGGWRVRAGDSAVSAARVVLAIPAPQAGRLLGAGHPLATALAPVEMAPCLTLMAAFTPDAPRPFRSRRNPDHALAWIAQDSSKPGREGPFTAWVAQAGPGWSAQHLELAPEQIAARMLPLLCAGIGADPTQALHVAAHRWRHALVARALGQPFLRSADGRLHLGGDWCLGARVEAAWASGRAIAADILADPPRG